MCVLRIIFSTYVIFTALGLDLASIQQVNNDDFLENVRLITNCVPLECFGLLEHANNGGLRTST